VAVILVACVAVFVLAAVGLVLWHTERGSLDRIVTDHLREKYVVTLKSGETFDGVLTEADGRVLVSGGSLAPISYSDEVPQYTNQNYYPGTGLALSKAFASYGRSTRARCGSRRWSTSSRSGPPGCR
jgi:hypothetical protein